MSIKKKRPAWVLPLIVALSVLLVGLFFTIYNFIGCVIGIENLLNPKGPNAKSEREFFAIASEYLSDKYGFNKNGMKSVRYSPFRGGGGGLMGGGSDRQAWMVIELADKTRIKVREGWRVTDTYSEKMLFNDYQLMEESLWSAEYLSGVFGLDIGFVELFMDGRQDSIALSSTNNRLKTKDSIKEHLFEFLGSGTGIVMYFKADFANDDLDSIFENAFNTYLASPLAGIRAEIILCAHDVELNIVRVTTDNPTPDFLYVSDEYLWGETMHEGSIRRVLHRPHEHYRAYVLRNSGGHMGYYIVDGPNW
jgi:hypothetical protein